MRRSLRAFGHLTSPRLFADAIAAGATMTVHDALPSGPNDFNLYSGLIALGVGLFGCLLVRFSNPRPTGDALSWLVHTRLGPGPKSFLGRQLDLGVLLTATYVRALVDFSPRLIGSYARAIHSASRRASFLSYHST